MIEQFKTEVDEGLSATNKHLPSKYFYDERGDELFVQIMNSPEYYLTDAEHEIFKNQTQEIVKAFGINGEHFELVELGAGDGTKTLELLRHLEGKYAFDFMPIDISKNALSKLKERLNKEVPKVKVKPQHGMYFSVLEEIKKIHRPMIVLFLGSNLGNMLDDKANEFIKQLAGAMNTGDKLLLGVDRKKRKDIILPAYNDAAGITQAFNLNLLNRMNSELGANFVVSQFEHAPEYNEQTGIAASYLKSLIDQRVFIKALDKEFEFKQGEKIHTEISRKYDDDAIAAVINKTGLKVVKVFTDNRNYFADYLLVKL